MSAADIPISTPQPVMSFSAVARFTYNFLNPTTQYQSGVDFHLDWGASQFLSKQFFIGLVGYAYDQVSADSGSGDRGRSVLSRGCFRSVPNWDIFSPLRETGFPGLEVVFRV